MRSFDKTPEDDCWPAERLPVQHLRGPRYTMVFDPLDRRRAIFCPGVALRNRQPIYRGLGSIGAGFIYKAMSTAPALGFKEFLATVTFSRQKEDPRKERQFRGNRLPHRGISTSDIGHEPPLFPRPQRGKCLVNAVLQ